MTSVSDSNDTFTTKDMILRDDVASFVAAMVKEVNDHKKHNHWSVVH